MNLRPGEQPHRRAGGAHAVADENGGAVFLQPAAHVPGAYVRFEVEKGRFAKEADLSAMSVAEKSQIEPVIVAVAAAGLEHVGQQVGGVARENHKIVGLDLSGHARHVRIAVVVVVYARNVEIGLPALDRGNVVHQRDNAPALDGADQHGKIALRLGAVVIAQHRVYADSGGNGGQIFKKGNGPVAVLGVVAAQNDQIGAEAVDGLDALKVFEESKIGYFDLILMDVVMPNMNGLSATRAIRELNRIDSNLPIIALSANAYAEDIKKTKDAGMNDYVSKPFKIENLVEMIDKYC